MYMYSLLKWPVIKSLGTTVVEYTWIRIKVWKKAPFLVQGSLRQEDLYEEKISILQ